MGAALEGEGCDRQWITPGDVYSVTVTLRPPFVPLRLTQTRAMGWELEPFAFYALRLVSGSLVSCKPFLLLF